MKPGTIHQDEVKRRIKAIELGSSLEKLWFHQEQYNTDVQLTDGNGEIDKHHWTQVYLMGLVSEIDEVLREIKWKRHKPQADRPVVLSNLRQELADLTKYVLSLWQLWDFSPEDALAACQEKTELLMAARRMDYNLLPHRRTLMLDLDGTVADYRRGIQDFFNRKVITNPAQSSRYQMDLAMGIGFGTYNTIKDQFEAAGGYRDLKPFPDAVRAVQALAEDTNIVVVTARPSYLSRTWGDAYNWVNEHVIDPDRLYVVGGERVGIALSLRQQGQDVIAFEDEPLSAERYAQNGIRVYMRYEQYNAGTVHPNITPIDKYPDSPTFYFGRKD